MKLLFRQRFFSWLDSYDVFNERGETVFTVEGKLAWGHTLHILDRRGEHVGTVKERIMTLLPKFEIYVHDEYAGCISKELTFFKPAYNIDFNGWHVEGSFWEWDYSVVDGGGRQIARISKELFNLTDTYSIEVNNSADALCALMLVLAIDAEKCSRE